MDYVRFRTRLKDILKQKGMRMNEAAYAIEKKHGYISAVIRDEQNMNVRDFLNLCDAIGVSPQDFFNEEVEDPSAVYELILEARNLNGKQIKSMLEMVRNLKN